MKMRTTIKILEGLKEIIVIEGREIPEITSGLMETVLSIEQNVEKLTGLRCHVHVDPVQSLSKTDQMLDEERRNR